MHEELLAVHNSLVNGSFMNEDLDLKTLMIISKKLQQRKNEIITQNGEVAESCFLNGFKKAQDVIEQEIIKKETLNICVPGYHEYCKWQIYKNS
jgi:hypothetical protein